MQAVPVAQRIFRAPGGRVRLGWRLSLFMLLAATLFLAGVVVMPRGIVTSSLALLIGAVAAGVIMLALDGRPAAALGFYAGRAGASETGLGILAGVAVAVVAVAVMASFGALAWSAEEGTIVAWLVGAGSTILFLTLPAAAEEALLRGYPLQAIAEIHGPWAAIIVTSAVFAAMHQGNPGLTLIGVLNIAAAGVLLGIIYLKTLSLWWATGVHLGWNWAHGYLADVPVSGLELVDAPFYEGVPRGSEWLSGGAFGPEGSLLATLVVLAAAALAWQSRWLRPSPDAISAQPLAAPLAPFSHTTMSE
jgi:membrane protease YdiL (CAAX protease family)